MSIYQKKTRRREKPPAKLPELPQTDDGMWKNRIIYNPPTRFGFWVEDMALQEEKLRIYAFKRDNCQLLVQKTRNMFRNLLRPVELSTPSPAVMYGDVYQIKACDVPNTIKQESGFRATHGLYLSGLLNEHDINFNEHFIHGCELTASPTKVPCVRNTFVFEPCDGNRILNNVCYGIPVFLRIHESGSDQPLFVQYESPTLDNFGEQMQVRLTTSPDTYCMFKVQHWKQCMRDVLKGTGVSPNAPVVIQHAPLGQNLCVEPVMWIPTLFGAECRITCKTTKNQYGIETAENIWMIKSAESVDMTLYVRAAKGEEIPLDSLN